VPNRKKLKILGIIPSRFASSRLPGKPLAVLHGKSMIQRVYEQCCKSLSLHETVVATDDESIAEHLRSFGGKYIMTDKNHLNGTSRCAEVIQQKKYQDFSAIINIQGDEPLLHPNQIDELATLLSNDGISIATQAKKEHQLELLENPNIVKVIIDEHNNAIDFCRIIHNKQQLQNIQKAGFFYKHIGMYGFKSDVLLQLMQLKPSKNEIENHLEQLRWLDNGFNIKIGLTSYESISIDTKEDVDKAILILKEQENS